MFFFRAENNVRLLHKNGSEFMLAKEDQMLVSTFILLLLCSLSVIDPIFPVGNPFREYLFIPFILSNFAMAIWFREPAFFLPYAIGSAVYDVTRQDVFWTIQVPLLTIIVCAKYWKMKRVNHRKEKR